FLTAYQPDRGLRERVEAALATLTTQGRAVGYYVVAALQDPGRRSCRSGICSRTGSRCGWTNRSRQTWCSVTAPATAPVEPRPPDATVGPPTRRTLENELPAQCHRQPNKVTKD